MSSTDLDSHDILEWGSNFLLGYAPMDAVHEEFVNLLARLQVAADTDILLVFRELAQHTRAHFDLENQWMLSTEFPARECHMDEHAAVIRSIEDVLELLEEGDFQVCRRLGSALTTWFPNHADYLDSALAHWMCKSRLGGKPIVVRKNMRF